MHLINDFLHSYGYLAVFLFIALESAGSPLPGVKSASWSKCR